MLENALSVSFWRRFSLFALRMSLLCRYVRAGKRPGHAVLCAHPVVGNEPVAVILPDVILDEYESDLSQDNWLK